MLSLLLLSLSVTITPFSPRVIDAYTHMMRLHFGTHRVQFLVNVCAQFRMLTFLYYHEQARAIRGAIFFRLCFCRPMVEEGDLQGNDGSRSIRARKQAYF